MRSLVLSVGCLVWLATPTVQSDPLDRPISDRFLGATWIALPVAPPDVPQVLPRVLSGARLPLGIEGVAGPLWTVGAGHRYVHLSGLTVREALDVIVPRPGPYEWRQIGDAIAVRPTESWTQRGHPLHRRIEPFDLTDVDLAGALGQLLDRAALMPAPAHGVRWTGPIDRRRFSVRLRAGTLMDGLNAIVRAHGDAFWRLHYSFRRAPADREGTHGLLELVGYEIGSAGAFVPISRVEVASAPH